MLEIDQDFISHIVKNQNLDKVLEAGVKREDFLDEGRRMFDLIHEHFTTYDKCPDLRTFKILRGENEKFRLSKGAQPLEFYLEKIVERRCQLLVLKNQERVSGAVAKGDWKAAAEAIYKTSNEIVQDIKTGDQELYTFEDMVRERIDAFKRARGAKDGITGYKFPWHSLNQISGGFHPTDYVLFAGETGVGKSFLAGLLVNSFIDQGLKVLVVSKEMPIVEFQTRVVCIRGKFSLEQVTKGRLSKEDRIRYFKFEKRAWKDVDVHFASEGEVDNHTDLERLVRKVRPNVCVVDGVYLLARNSNAPWHERVTEASTRGRMICLNNGVLGCDTSQLLFDGKGKEDYSLADLADAKKQARNATHVFFLVRNQKLKILKRAQIINLKARKGKERCIELNWDIDNNNYSEIQRIELQVSRNGRKATPVNEEQDEVPF